MANGISPVSRGQFSPTMTTSRRFDAWKLQEEQKGIMPRGGFESV
jgi:hypothetical protein